jgi:hypothetical protein
MKKINSVKRLNLLLSIIMLSASIFAATAPVWADSPGEDISLDTASLKIDGGVTDWVYDTKSDFIYAISSDSGNLLCINTDTFTVESREYIGGNPTDIELYKDKLYIALSESTRVAVKDIATRSNKSYFIELDSRPYYIEIGNGKLFYTGRYEYQDIYAYDFAAQKSARVMIKGGAYSTFYYPGLSIDEAKGLLYITEYHDNLTSLNVQDYSSAVTIGWNGMENDRNQLDPVIKYGGDLFLGKNTLEMNAKTVKDSFGSNVLYVNDSYVFTKHAVYDRITGDKSADLPVIADLAIGKGNEFFIYNNEANIVYKYSSVQSIIKPLAKTIKVNMDKAGKLIFTWDEMPNPGGYHLYYSYDGYQIAKDNYTFEIGGSSPKKSNRFTLDQVEDAWKNGIVFFGLKAEEGKDWTRIAPSNIIEVRFKDGVPLADGLTEDSFKNEDGAFDLKTVVKLSEGPNMDGTISSRFSFDEFLFTSFFKQIGKNMESFELDAARNSSVVSLQIPGQVYKLLREEGKEKKLVVHSEDGKYILPVGAIDISGIMEDPDNTRIYIEISKVTGSSLTGLGDTLSGGGLQLLGSPVSFDLSAQRNGGFSEIKRFGSDYFECWIPLVGEPDRANTVGIYYDSNTRKVQHTPTRFQRDSSGKYWAVLKQNGNGIYALVKHSKTFNDIFSSWAKKDIELLASKLVVNGLNGTQFAPDSEVTRAEYVTLLVRALGLITDVDPDSAFSDVNKGDWYYQVVQTAYELGLVNGMNDGTFKPNAPISREEMAALIVRAMKFIDAETGKAGNTVGVLDSLKDRDKISAWALESVEAAVENGIINGNQNSCFAPAEHASRAESAAVIDRMLKRLELIEG